MKTLLLTLILSSTAMATDYVSKVDFVVPMDELTSVKTQDTNCMATNLINNDESGIYKRMAKRIHAISALASKLSQDLNIDACVVISMIAQESSFDAHAISNKNKAKTNKKVVQAKGLMQVIPSTRKSIVEEFGSKMNLMITSNLDSGLTVKEIDSLIVGTKYFQFLMKKFKNMNTAVIAYNEGPTKIQKMINKKIPFGQNHNHLIKVKENLAILAMN